MTNRNYAFFAFAGLSLFLSSAAIADSSGQKINVAAPQASQTQALEKLIQENTEKKRQADTSKYAQITAVAGSRKSELAKKRNEVNEAYNKWLELKSAAESARNTGTSHFKVVENAAEAYSKANQEFIALQKDILAKNGVASDDLNARVVVNIIPSDAIDSVNTAPATAAGKK